MGINGWDSAGIFEQSFVLNSSSSDVGDENMKYQLSLSDALMLIIHYLTHLD